MEHGQKFKLVLMLLKAMHKKSKNDKHMKKYLDKYEEMVGKRVMKRIYNVYLSDEKAFFWFMIDSDGTLDWGAGENKNAHTTVYTDADTLLALRERKIKVLDHKTGQITSVPYTFMDACRIGKIKWSGVASTQDVKRFMDLLASEPNMLEELLP